MAGKAAKTRRWSQRVTEYSNALDLDKRVFTLDSPRRIAQSLKKSAESSNRRKSEPYRSAMSMLTFCINRAGKNPPAKRRKTLTAAEDELRRVFGRARGRRRVRTAGCGCVPPRRASRHIWRRARFRASSA